MQLRDLYGMLEKAVPDIKKNINKYNMYKL